MGLVSNFAFGVLLVIGIGFFVRNINKLRRNIKQGKSVEISGSSHQRWKNMAKGINVIPVPKKFIAKNEKISKDKKYDFALNNKEAIHIACDEEHVDKDFILNDTKEIAIFPPVTGG